VTNPVSHEVVEAAAALCGVGLADVMHLAGAQTSVTFEVGFVVRLYRGA
jgi:hypothetical protein